MLVDMAIIAPSSQVSVTSADLGWHGGRGERYQALLQVGNPLPVELLERNWCPDGLYGSFRH